MSSFENIYSWEVIEEIKKGNEVFVIDRVCVESAFAIQRAGGLTAEKLLRIVNSDNKNNRYGFYKVVKTNE